MNLLQLVQQATAEMGLPVPATVAGNTASDVVQQLALLNAVGSELLEFDWQALQTEYRFTTQYLLTTGTVTSGSAVITGIPSTTGLDATYMVSGTGINQDTYVSTVDSGTQVTLSQAATATGSQALTFGKTKYALPSDFRRQINRTHYDKSKRWAMLGPETAQQWQFLKSSYISTGPRIRYRIMGGYFQIWPLLGTPEYLGFEYISNSWVTSNTGTGKTAFSSDTDTCIFPDRLMILGLKLKYFEVKGFDTTAFYRDYQNQLDIAKAGDHGAPTLSFAPQVSEVLIGYENIPDSNYGS
jgi:hypothetical protein